MLTTAASELGCALPEGQQAFDVEIAVLRHAFGGTLVVCDGARVLREEPLHADRPHVARLRLNLRDPRPLRVA
jgi:hypothetical protein